MLFEQRSVPTSYMPRDRTAWFDWLLALQMTGKLLSCLDSAFNKRVDRSAEAGDAVVRTFRGSFHDRQSHPINKSCDWPGAD